MTYAAFDICIIGAGPAGSAAAIMLARAGHSVALIERSRFQEIRIGETLPPRAQPLLAALGVPLAETLISTRAPGIVSVWGDAEPRSHDFLASPYGTGWHIDRARFDRALARQAVACGATLLEESAVTEAERGPLWRLSLTRGVSMTCRFLIDASGRRATRLKRLAGPARARDGLVGIAAFTDTCAVADARTLVEATRDGWWYSTCLPGNRQVVVHMTDADDLSGKSDLPRLLKKRVSSAPHTCQHSEGLSRVNGVRVFPAMTGRRECVHGENWLLCGDAAMTWDPLSGQGICKALESGIRAADAADRALHGDARGLDAYASWTRVAFAEYLRARQHYYRAERRWPDAPFWQRRHSARVQ